MTNACGHDRVAPIPVARASEVFATPELRRKRVYLRGAGLRRCEACQRVLLPPGSEPQRLKAACVTLAGGLRSAQDAVTLVLGRALGQQGAEPHTPDADEPEGDSLQGFRCTTPRFRLEDVILPERTMTEILEALTKLEYRELIYDRWGFGSVDPAGRGARLNFYGPPGTGKTRTAEAIAGELGKPLLALTAADVESRYMGETPKRIQAAFDAARHHDAVLFFDEADSLFGKRASDVSQGVDHEINAAKSTLLVEVEKYEGILILASNFQGNFDRAFVRRIGYHVRFLKPDAPARERLWEYHLVAGIPLSEPRGTLISQLTERSEGLSGGDILTTLRLALPASIRCSPEQPLLAREHLLAAIERVRRAKREIGANRARGPGAHRLPWLRSEGAPTAASDTAEPDEATSRTPSPLSTEKGEQR